jgi:transcriptional regulator NrdR family protein
MNKEFLDTSNKVFRQTIMIIDALTQRGSFKGEELSTIGNLRDACNQLSQAIDNYEAEVASQVSDEQLSELESENITENVKGNTSSSLS